jgi:ASC-1-like (ASCH) protein
VAESEEIITIFDDSGRKKAERVVYSVKDVFGDKVHVTEEGLQYARDSLRRKGQIRFAAQLEQIPRVLSHPDIVIRDPSFPKDTVIYYKRYYERRKRQYQVIAIIIKEQSPIKFLYNIHPQQSGKVKGYREMPKPEVLYLNPQSRLRDFGL